MLVMMRFSRPRTFFLLLVLALLSETARGGDWPQWRGPHRDGIVSGIVLPAKWPESLKKEWQVTVGEGYSSPVVVGDRIFLLVRQGDEEAILGLDLGSGKEIWRTSYPVPYEMHIAARPHGKGPKSTPVVSNGKIYTFGISGILSCLDTVSGKALWRKDFAKQYANSSPLYGTAMSPLVEDGLLLAHVGGHDRGAMVAFDAGTGEVRWENHFDGPGYASPIAVDLAGERQIVTQTQDHVLGLALASGKLLWRIPFKTDYDQNIVTPVGYQDLLIYSGVSQPLTAIRLEKTAAGMVPHEVWKTEAHPLYMSSPVLKDNLLFGLSHRKSGQLFCVDAATGKTLWQNAGRMGDNGALLLAGSLLLLLNDHGQLLVIRPTNVSLELLKQYQVADSPTWAHPVLLENRLLVKDKTTLTSWSLKN
jgi:outer membrane protein assembly factor BamB